MGVDSISQKLNQINSVAKQIVKIMSKDRLTYEDRASVVSSVEKIYELIYELVELLKQENKFEKRNITKELDYVVKIIQDAVDKNFTELMTVSEKIENHLSRYDISGSVKSIETGIRQISQSQKQVHSEISQAIKEFAKDKEKTNENLIALILFVSVMIAISAVAVAFVSSGIKTVILFATGMLSGAGIVYGYIQYSRGGK